MIPLLEKGHFIFGIQRTFVQICFWGGGGNLEKEAVTVHP